MHSIIRILALGYILASCTTAGVYHYTSERPVVSNSDCKLDMYWDKNQVGEQVELLCEVQANVPVFPWSEQFSDRALKEAMPLACSCGASAIYIRNTYKQGLKVVGFRFTGEVKPKAISQEDLLTRLVCLEKNHIWRDDHCVVEEIKLGDEVLQHRKRASQN